jgi:hypothetical protein
MTDPVPSFDAISQLERLAALKERGHITDEEYAAQKQKLLGVAAPTSPPPSPPLQATQPPTKASVRNEGFSTDEDNGSTRAPKITRKIHPLLSLFIIVGIGGSLIGVVVAAIQFSMVGVVACLVFGATFWYAAYIGWAIGDAFRRWIRPDSIFVFGGVTQLVKTRLFWMVGPQTVGVLVAAAICGSVAVIIAGLAGSLFGVSPPNAAGAQAASAAAPAVSPSAANVMSAAAVQAASPPVSSVPAPDESSAEPAVTPDQQAAPQQQDIPAITPESNAELGRAVRDALSLGRSLSWRSDAGDASGYVSVSSAQDYGDRTCRTYRYTVQNGPEVSPPKDGTACRVGLGDWNLNSQ